MNNVLLNTHTTLTERHATFSLTSLSNQPIIWDNLLIYNSHQEEISNEWLISKANNLLNWTAKYSIEDSVKLLLKYYRSQS